MNSIVITHYRPHKPASGAALRNWQNISALAAFGSVDVVSVGGEDTSESVDRIREWTPFSLTNRSRWDRMKTACSPLRPGVYPGVDLYHSERVTSWLRDRASQRRYDLAVIETISLAAYLKDLKRAADCVVFDAHNIESALYAQLIETPSTSARPMAHRIKDWVLKRRMAAAEGRVVTGADLVWVCSDSDAQEMAGLYGRRTGVTVVPNGVDVEAYRRAGALPPDADWSRTPLTMVYPGLFDYSPNEEAALRLINEVLPAVRHRGYQARVVLIGRNPTPALIDAARRTTNVEVTGAVDSVIPYLEQACVVTLPIMVGSGTRLKILEAFAVGRPVVSTSKGVQGIDVVDGEHLLIREGAEGMADAVIDLWRHPQLRASLCGSALELVRTRASWSVVAERIAQSLKFERGLANVETSLRSENAARS